MNEQPNPTRRTAIARVTSRNQRPASGRQVASAGNTDYTPEDLQHLSDMEHVRERPAMYIGDITGRGLHHLVYEVVDNSIDEAMAGFAAERQRDESTTTARSPSKTMVAVFPSSGTSNCRRRLDRDVSTLEGVMTVLKFGGKFEKGAYQTSGGLHGVGVTVVNFLVAMVRGRSLSRRTRLSAGIRTRHSAGPGSARRQRRNKVGTKTTFKPDSQIFQTTKFSYDTLSQAAAGVGFSESRRADHLP